MKNKLGIIILGTLISACGSSVHRGLVAMKINEEIAHVCVDKNEVQPGIR
ncbi:MAG TPA: hypothetical protein PKA63_12735 [Oligoflexia bacterium]|nr:hypothetical protein [Oligoflexia bacterium]HMP49524.1 hypothetical protein [Oligoflexia bacterium]